MWFSATFALLACMLQASGSLGQSLDLNSTVTNYTHASQCFEYVNNSTAPLSSFVNMYDGQYLGRLCQRQAGVEERVLQCHDKFSYRAIAQSNFLEQDNPAARVYAEDNLETLLRFCIMQRPEELQRTVEAFLCAVFFPPCNPQPVTPCRELCEFFIKTCRSSMRMMRYSWPVQLRCSNFPSASSNALLTPSSTASSGTPTRSEETSAAQTSAVTPASKREKTKMPPVESGGNFRSRMDQLETSTATTLRSTTSATSSPLTYRQTTSLAATQSRQVAKGLDKRTEGENKNDKADSKLPEKKAAAMAQPNSAATLESSRFFTFVAFLLVSFRTSLLRLFAV